MVEIDNSYDKHESEQDSTGGTRAIVSSLTEAFELDRVDFETMIDEIRI